MGDPVADAARRADPPSRWALSVVATVVTTALLWDPGATTYGALKAVLFAAGSLWAVCAAARRVRLGARWSLGEALPGVALVLWAAVTLVWTPSLPAGAVALQASLAALALLAASRVLLQSAAQARWLAIGVACTAGLMAVFALAQYGLGAGPPTSTLGNSNHLAAYLAASLPLALWSVGRFGAPADRPPSERSRIGRVAAGLAVAALLLAAVLTTGCRSAAVALVAAGLGAWALSRRTRPGRVRALAAVALVGLLVGGSVLVQGTGPRSLQGRLYLAQVSWRLAAERPLLGHGVGAYALRFGAEQGVFLDAHPSQRIHWTHAKSAHNEPLQALTELGLVGLVLLGALTVWLLSAMVGPRGPPTPRRVAAGASLTALAVCSLAESTLHQPALLALAAVNVGVLTSRSAPKTARRGPPPNATVSGPLLAFIAAVSVVAATRQYAADRLLAQAHLAESDGQRLALCRRAARVAVNPGRARFYQGLALAGLGRPAAATRALRRSAADFPNLSTHVALGNALSARGDHRAARAAYAHAAWLNPRYAAAHHNLGLIQARLGRPRAAQQSLRRARQLLPGRWLEPWRLRVLRRARSHRRASATAVPSRPAQARAPGAGAAR